MGTHGDSWGLIRDSFKIRGTHGPKIETLVGLDDLHQFSRKWTTLALFREVLLSNLGHFGVFLT